jgi:hypothetical protein
MSPFTKAVLAAVVAVGLAAPAFAQMKGDAGSGPTNGAVSTNDAGSGPTSGATPKMGSTAANTSNTATTATQNDENSAGVTPGPKSTGGSQPVTPITPEKKQ